MQTRYAKPLLSLAAVAALAVPAVAQARFGSDDPPNHVRREHHRLQHHRQRVDDGRRSDNLVEHARRGSDDGAGRGSDDGVNHARRGSDDGIDHARR
jgi:hypothetical protein